MKLQMWPQEVVPYTNTQFTRGVRRRRVLEWPALLRKLDRKDASYAS